MRLFIGKKSKKITPFLYQYFRHQLNFQKLPQVQELPQVQKLPQVQELAHKQAMKGFGTALGVMEFTALKRRLDRLGSDSAN